MIKKIQSDFSRMYFGIIYYICQWVIHHCLCMNSSKMWTSEIFIFISLFIASFLTTPLENDCGLNL